MRVLSLRSTASAVFVGVLTAVAACQNNAPKLILTDLVTGSGGGGGSDSGAGGAGCDKTPCDGACVDTTLDPKNCGACGKACAAGETCTNGVCELVCGGGTTKCPGPMGSLCAETQYDPANCGACGKACAAGEVCDNGMCTTECGGGTTQCGQSCVEVNFNPKHCGKCDAACPGAPNAKAFCTDATCGLTCGADYGDCNQDMKDGCEKPLITADDCGKCGNKCVLPHAAAACVSAACIVKTCDAGYGDCDKDGKSCETNLNSDAANCGACGKKCAALESCSNGKCMQVGCQNGAVELSASPNGDMKVCDDPLDKTCEQDQATLCPPTWRLCSREQFVNRNNGWNYPIGGNNTVVAEIYCRGGGGAGHYTLGPYGGSTLGDDVPFNCGYGSSRPSCPSGYGCNETYVQALCCAPTPSCGNGVVDSVEEGCDDGNNDDGDACLSNCTARLPGGGC